MQIVVIGYGNVGYHLSQAIMASPHHLLQIVNRSVVNESNSVMPISLLNDIQLNADLYIIAVKDAAIEEVVKNLPNLQNIVVHCSGTVCMEILNKFKHYGVFYPLQTFTKSKPINFTSLPICIDGNSFEVKNILLNFASSLSQKVYQINTHQRQVLHLAAVFANNFTNHLLSISEQICLQHQINFDILKPLITETLEKIQQESPKAMQTGPAKRNDISTIESHKLLLKKEFPLIYLQIYENLTTSINQLYNTPN